MLLIEGLPCSCIGSVLRPAAVPLLAGLEQNPQYEQPECGEKLSILFGQMAEWLRRLVDHPLALEHL